jgi:hypothetical protein
MPNSSMALAISAIVDAAGRRDGQVGIVAVRQLRGGGQHLHVDACAVHQPQPCVEFRAAARADPPLGGGVGLAQLDEQVEVGVRPVVRVHVDPHARQRYSVERHAGRRSMNTLRDCNRTSVECHDRETSR